MSEIITAIILGIVEGITEFLPVSSTGHLLLCEIAMKIDLKNDPFWRMFTIFIQIGAIAAVVIYFRREIRELAHPRNLLSSSGRWPPIVLVLIGSIPAFVIGYLTHGWVEAHMENARNIAAALLIGGLLIMLIEWRHPRPRTFELGNISFAQAFFIGCAQVLAAVFPGTSRSAATIMGGMVGGLARQPAAEFSFFLAIPVMLAACLYSLLKSQATLTPHRVIVLAVGTIVSFLVAWLVIAAFMKFIRQHNFIPFALWRILLALLVFISIGR